MAEYKKLGRYELRRVLGKGAMGVVYEGFDPTLGRRVAVKTILRNAAIDAETERAYAERFEREAKAVARLNHPRIVQVHDFGEEKDVAFLVMEFIEGRELRHFFDTGERFEGAETVRIMGELLDALEFAHEHGVIHRDVKPANVMLDAERHVKLADFGVARIQDSDRSAAGTMVGTPAYMSPEQIQGGKIDRRTDVFAAGVILYQMLTGRQPFQGEGAWTVARKIMQDEATPPSLVTASVPPLFDEVVQRALAKSAAERFSSARQFAEALRGAQSGERTAPMLAPAPSRAQALSPRASQTEIEFWRSIQDSDDGTEFELYLKKFPDGMYAELARVKADKLRDGRARQPAASDATVAIAERPAAPATQRVLSRSAAIALVVIAVAGAYYFFGRDTGTAQVTLPAAEVEKIRKETEARIRREFADKSAAEQAAAAKAATEKAVQEKQAALNAAAEKAAADRAAAEKQRAEKQLAEKLAAVKSASERATLEKAAAEKAAADKIAAEKAATEKAAGERLAAEKAAAAKVAAEKAAAEKVAAEAAAAKAATEKLAVAKAAAEKAAPSNDELLAKFIERHGREKVMDKEPPAVPGAMRQGEIVYVNDGSCGTGSIREVIGNFIGAGMIPRARGSRCISLRD